jgi:hypothetical protein
MSISNIQPCVTNGQGRSDRAASLDSYGVKSGESAKTAYLGLHRAKVELRFTPAKRRARAMAHYIRGQAVGCADDAVILPTREEDGPTESIQKKKLKRLAFEVSMCRNSLLFRNHYTEGKITLSQMKSCKHTRLCPLCAIAQANAHVSTYHKKTLQLLEQHRHDGMPLRAFFVTLTVKNGVSLPATYEHFSDSVQHLVNRRRDAIKARGGSVKHQYALTSVMAPVVAGVFSFEVKRGAGSGDWHPHTHGLLLSTTAIDEEALSEEWKGITGDSHVVNCQEIDATDVKSLCEVLKYSLKFSEMSLEDNFEAATVLHRKRLLRSFGEFYGMQPDPNVDIDDVSVLDSPYIEQLYLYKEGSYTLIPSDGSVKLPEKVDRDITPMRFRQYNVGFMPGIQHLGGFEGIGPPKTGGSFKGHLPFNEGSMNGKSVFNEGSFTFTKLEVGYEGGSVQQQRGGWEEHPCLAHGILRDGAQGGADGY